MLIYSKSFIFLCVCFFFIFLLPSCRVYAFEHVWLHTNSILGYDLQPFTWPTFLFVLGQNQVFELETPHKSRPWSIASEYVKNDSWKTSKAEIVYFKLLLLWSHNPCCTILCWCSIWHVIELTSFFSGSSLLCMFCFWAFVNAIGCYVQLIDRTH